MVPLIFIGYYGEVGINIWEYQLTLAYIAIMYLYFSRKKNLNIKLRPEYKYLVSGLMVKIIGGVIFSLIYFYYYQGGDTTSYFYSGVAMTRMLFIDPFEFIRQTIFGDNSLRALQTYTAQDVRPYAYMFRDTHTFQVLRIVSWLALLTFNSYLISTLLLASISFLGIWLGYLTFVSYYPAIMNKLAIGFLFMPSAIFWGSGILKDTLTFSAVCAWVHAVDEVFFKRRNTVSRGILLIVSALVMIKVKPYIFMVMVPATLLWLLYMRVARIKNILVRFVVIPTTVAVLIIMSIAILARMQNLLGKFALDEALVNIENIQTDMAHNDSYGDNKFDVGSFDGTWWGVVKKFPVATNAVLFRPYLWESRSVVIGLSGLENLFVLGLTLYVLFKAGLRFSWRCITSIPLLLMSMSFALLFAFVVGVTTANFGALVRFKIPMLPFYICSLYIILYLAAERKRARSKGLRFNLADYRSGAPARTDTKRRGALPQVQRKRPMGR